MEIIERDYNDVEFIVEQKAINDILISNKAFSNVLIFNYVTSKDTGIGPELIDTKLKESLLSCGVKEFAVNYCKDHLDVLKRSLSGAENAQFMSALNQDRDYSIELMDDGTLEVLEIDKDRSKSLQQDIHSNKKQLGVINGGLVANFIHNWKISAKLAGLYLEKLMSEKETIYVLHKTEIKMDELKKFVNELDKQVKNFPGRQYEISIEDLTRLDTLGVNFRDISLDNWLKIARGEISGPVDMKMGNSVIPVLLTIKDEQIGCYHLNEVSRKEFLDLNKEENTRDIKQEIGNYLFSELGISNVGFSEQDFDLIKNGQFSQVLMRSKLNDVFGSDEYENRMGKVRLNFDEKGKIVGHEVLPKVEVLNVSDSFKGNKLTNEQVQELKSSSELKEIVSLKLGTRENVAGFLSIDHSLNQVVFLACDQIKIPSKVNGNEISEDYKSQLLMGKHVIFYDFRHDGEDITAVVQLDKRTGQLEVEKLEEYVERIDKKPELKALEIPEIFMGYEFSNKDILALKEESGLKDAVFVEMNGEQVEGFISVENKKNELVFLPKSEILIDKDVLGKNELTKEQKQALVNGYSVLFPDFEQDGIKSNVQIVINRLDGTTKIFPAISGKQLFEHNQIKAMQEKNNKKVEERENTSPKIK